MFSHVFLCTNDVEKSRKFYNATMGAIGHEAGFEVPRGTVYRSDEGALILATPANGEAATVANGHTLGLKARNYDEVDRWHQAGIAAGGTCEGPPGFRPRSPGNSYGAYLRDPDGNKLCCYAPNVGER